VALAETSRVFELSGRAGTSAGTSLRLQLEVILRMGEKRNFSHVQADKGIRNPRLLSKKNVPSWGSKERNREKIGERQCRTVRGRKKIPKNGGSGQDVNTRHM